MCDCYMCICVVCKVILFIKNPLEVKCVEFSRCGRVESRVKL